MCAFPAAEPSSPNRKAVSHYRRYCFCRGRVVPAGAPARPVANRVRGGGPPSVRGDGSPLGQHGYALSRVAHKESPEKKGWCGPQARMHIYQNRQPYAQGKGGHRGQENMARAAWLDGTRLKCGKLQRQSTAPTRRSQEYSAGPSRSHGPHGGVPPWRRAPCKTQKLGASGAGGRTGGVLGRRVWVGKRPGKKGVAAAMLRGLARAW